MYEDLDTSGEEFNWDDYLKTGGAEAAPASCFCQNRQPPPNEFKVGHKLETYDPRNTSSICIGSVIEVSGSRIRLRLDGTDDRNDFWLMVDSDLIHPFEHAAKHGRNIQPPLGFGNDLSKWPKFLEKIIHNAKENMFAPETCFKSPPPRPPKNEFKVGQKLEAVDPKNPHLVCPATVREVKLDKLLVAFDGWHQSSYFWCSYSSRDLFPVGWCKLSGHKLQRPGTLEDKISSKAAAAAANLSATSKLNANKSIAETPATAAAATTAPTTAPTPVKKAKAKKSATASSEPPAAKKANLNTSNASADSSSSLLNVTTDENKSMAIVKPTTAKAPKRLTNRAVTSQADSTVATSSPQAPVDLSIIKTEALDPSESPILTNEVVKDKVILYVNPFGDCGKLIKNEPYHNAHLKFGPGTPPTIYRSVLQSFVDFAHNKPDFFNLVPVGKSDTFVKLKTPGISDKKKIPLIENEEEMWTSLRKFCDQIGINCDDFFNRNSYAPFHSTLKKKGTQPVGYSTPISNSKEKTQKASAAVSKSSAAAAVSSSNMPLTPQQTSSSSSASSSSSSSSSSTSSEVHTTVKKAHSSPKDTTAGPAQKRHVNTNNDSLVSNSDHQPYHESGYSVAKVARFEQTFETLPVTDWSTDQVVDYLVSTGDVNFTSHVDMFRLQEIDGKAFLLLSTETLMKYMGFKLGPALKLNNFIDRLRRSGMAKPIMADQISSTTVPKVECQ